MLLRWNSSLKNLKFFLNALDKILPFIKRKRQRGRPPKHSLRKYLKLIITKEFKHCSTRDAEHDLSRGVCKARVDHSVINYWDRFDKNFIQKIIKRIGTILCATLSYLFSFIDSTKFTLWCKNETEFHALVRIGDGFLYPVNVFFGCISPKTATK